MRTVVNAVMTIDVSVTTHAPLLILNDLTRSNLQLLAQIS